MCQHSPSIELIVRILRFIPLAGAGGMSAKLTDPPVADPTPESRLPGFTGEQAPEPGFDEPEDSSPLAAAANLRRMFSSISLKNLMVASLLAMYSALSDSEHSSRG